MSTPGLGAFSHVTVGVTRLDAATRFWRGNFGLRVRELREGPDEALAPLWAIPPTTITRQAMVATATGAGGSTWAPVGGLHLVEFSNPLPPVRRGARVYDRGPKNLDLYTADLPGHDEINVVLLEVVGPGYSTSLTDRGFAGIGPLVTIAGNGRAEAAFYRDVLGLPPTLELSLQGPEIERAVGLPPGAGLDLWVLGDPAEPLGRIEIIQYRPVQGEG